MEAFTATEVRVRLSEILKLAEKEVVQITQFNRPAAAVMSWDRYESLLETIEILIDTETFSMVRQGVMDFEMGRVVPWEEVKARIIGTE